MKRNIGLVFIGVLLSSLTFGVYAIVHKLNKKKEIAREIVQLPTFQLKNVIGKDSITDNTLDGFDRKYVVFFNSDCPHCQYEIESICKHMDDFQHDVFLMISDESPKILKKFYNDYQLNRYPICLASDPKSVVFDKFGATMFPSTFIYNNQNKLLRKLKGEVKPGLLIDVQ